MTSPNQWFGAIKSRAKSVQETAKLRIEKLTETIDKKLKEAQEDLEKQRSKAEASESNVEPPKKWQRSEENPNGEIITVPKTLPIALPTPSPENSLSESSFVDPPIIQHTVSRRRRKNGSPSVPSVTLDHELDSGNEQINSPIKEKNNREEITLYLKELIDEIIIRENVDKCLNELIDIIVTVDDLLENTTLITVLYKEDLISVQDSTKHFEDNITLDKVDSISSDTPSDTENNQMNIREDELLSFTNIDDPEIEQFDLEDAQTNISEDKSSPLMDTIDFLNHPTTSENIATTPSEELEDSFDSMKMPESRQIHPLSEKPLETFTELDALRALISTIEEGVDVDVDVEVSSPQQDITLFDKDENHSTKQQDIEDNLSSLHSISDDSEEKLPVESPLETDSSRSEQSIVEDNEDPSSVPKPIEMRRFSVANCHSIPSGTKIHHINCSSIYIYICANDRKIFYAKIDVDLSLTWQQHSELAEKLVVSVSNRTVWRLFNKRLYSSNDPLKLPPIGSQWNEIKIGNGQSLLSMSINDQCGWYIKDDGSLWLIRADDENRQSSNVTCPFNLKAVVCFSEKVGVTTNDGEILIRVGCTNDCLEGNGWIFIDHSFGPIDDFMLLTNDNIICIVDKKHHLWIHQWSSSGGFFEVLCNDDFSMSQHRRLMSVNSELLYLTDCENQMLIFSDSLTGIQWRIIDTNTRLQRLVGAFSDENYVWALTTDKIICSSNNQILEKPRQAQYLTHATFVPDNTSQDTILWSLDESCNIYVRANVDSTTQWEQLDQSQFQWNRRLVHIVCNSAGVWAVDDQGCIHFRHGHVCTGHNLDLNDPSLLPPAWIPIPGEPKRYRSFSHIFCGPADWMVYATDNKQTVYARLGINEENRIGTSWEAIEDCSALELAISEHTLWLLTSCGQIQCRENISLTNPTGTRSTTLPGLFLSLTVSMDDTQVWALDSKRNLLKLDRLTVLFEK